MRGGERAITWTKNRENDDSNSYIMSVMPQRPHHGNKSKQLNKICIIHNNPVIVFSLAIKRKHVGKLYHQDFTSPFNSLEILVSQKMSSSTNRMAVNNRKGKMWVN